MSFTVPVKVHPTIREFVISTNGSDLLQPQKDDWLWFILKQNLDVPPSDFVFTEIEKGSYINISLLNAHGEKVDVRNKSKRLVGNKKKDPYNIYLNTLFRWYLPDKGQNRIAKHLRNVFKECFHNFVQGALVSNPQSKQREIIFNFCEFYDIGYNEISIDMLIKSWQRSPQKERLKKLVPSCPLLF